MNKLSAEQAKRASTILGRLDKVAETIQMNHKSWGMPFAQAKGLVNELDVAADDFETMVFGAESFQRRQAEVIQQDGDEPYMKTFEKGTVVQQDGDEPYMSAYGDDQSSAVQSGKSTSGRSLT
jgi:hypothetical protein